MTDTPNRKACPKCGGPIQGGHVDYTGLSKGQVVFVVAGEPTKPNLAAAFRQGLQDIAPDQRFVLRGLRCADCGYVEFFADEQLG